jgi:hypothetical protein
MISKRNHSTIDILTPVEKGSEPKPTDSIGNKILVFTVLKYNNILSIAFLGNKSPQIVKYY